jgi:hypothetical protein
MMTHKPYVVPVERAIHRFGDVDFLENRGQLLLPGADVGDEPYIEAILEPSEDTRYTARARWTIYRVEPERKRLVITSENNAYLVPDGYNRSWPHPVPSYDEWFHKHLESVASYVDRDTHDLRMAFCSPDAVERAGAYIDLASHSGWHELDHYPLELTKHEAHERYGQLEDCECPVCREDED